MRSFGYRRLQGALAEGAEKSKGGNSLPNGSVFFLFFLNASTAAWSALVAVAFPFPFLSLFADLSSTAGASSSTSAFQRLPAELLLLVNEHLRYRDAWALKHACRYFFRVLDPGPKPKIPQTLAAWWDGKLVLYQTVVLGWRAGDTARSVRELPPYPALS